MSEGTLIQWTNATINFWWGCTEVSPACRLCYAREWAKYTSKNLFGFRVEWGNGKPRGERLEAARREALKLNAKAEKSGQRMLVFANSMADWLDAEVPVEWLAFMLQTLHDTPYLTWQLLTKRPENWAARIEAVLQMIEAAPTWNAAKADAPEVRLRNFLADWFVLRRSPVNVWIGVTAEDQPRADRRIAELVKIPAKVRFLSCEPLLERIDLHFAEASDGEVFPFPVVPPVEEPTGKLHWVIAGGESGGSKASPAKPTHPDWARSLRDQCAAAGVPFFWKQWGEWKPVSEGGDDWVESLYKANRIGRQCTVPSHVLHRDGSQHSHLDRGAFALGAMTMFCVGKKNSGNLLDGVEHNAFPA